MAKRFLTPLRLLNSSSDVESASSGDLYFNSSENDVKVYHSGQWNSVVSKIAIGYGESFPENAKNGEIFFNSSNSTLNIHFSGSWFEVGSVPPIEDSGDSSTQTFNTIIDGGDSVSTYAYIIDGGNSTDEDNSSKLLA